MTELITLEYDGAVAVMSNNRPDKHNAANDAMDRRLFDCLKELQDRDDVRAVVWRGNGKSFSSGRDTTELGIRTEDISDFDFIERGHAGTRRFFAAAACAVHWHRHPRIKSSRYVVPECCRRAPDG